MKNGPFEEVFLIQDRHLAFTMLWIAMKGKFHCQRLHKCGTPKPTMVVYLRRSVKLTIGVKIIQDPRKNNRSYTFNVLRFQPSSTWLSLVIKPIQDGLLISWGLGGCGVKSLGLGCKTATFRENYAKSFSFLASWSILARILWESEKPPDKHESENPLASQKKVSKKGRMIPIVLTFTEEIGGEWMSHLVEHSPAMRRSAAGSKQ